MVPWVRDRMVADPRFLFKVLAEVAIDSGKYLAARDEGCGVAAESYWWQLATCIILHFLTPSFHI